MRVFVTILALFVGIMASNHIILMFMVGGMVRATNAEDGAMAGIAMLFFWGVATAASYPRPRMAIAPFVVAALIGIGGGQSTSFRDLTLWGVASMALALLSVFSVREMDQVSQTNAQRNTSPQIFRPKEEG